MTTPPSDTYSEFWGDQYVKQNLTVNGNTTIASNLAVSGSIAGNTVASNTITTSGGTAALDIGKIANGTARYTRQIVTQVDSNTYTITGFLAGSSASGSGYGQWQQVLDKFTDIVGFQPGSLVKLSYHVPCRNDSATWGGMYLEPQISYNGGTKWWSLGGSGHDGGVMNQGYAVGSYFQSILIDPYVNGVSAGAGFGVQIRFYAIAYDGIVNVMINSGHNINTVSNTATIESGANGQQHFAHIIVEELALLRGSA